jgi:hypothetical protein
LYRKQQQAAPAFRLCRAFTQDLSDCFGKGKPVQGLYHKGLYAAGQRGLIYIIYL